jgi:hypothetical protein
MILEDIPRSVIDSILFLTEFSSCIKCFLEICLNCWWSLVIFMFWKSSGLIILKGGHSSVKFLICSYEFILWFCKNINILRINLKLKYSYFWRSSIISQCISEVDFSLVSPSMRVAIASICQGNIKITTWTIANVVYKFIWTSLVVLMGLLCVLSFWKIKITFSWRFELYSFMNKIFGE